MSIHYVQITGTQPSPTATMTTGGTGVYPHICSKCGGYLTNPVAWWSIIPPTLCACRSMPTFIGDGFDDWRRTEEDIWDELFAESSEYLAEMAAKVKADHLAGKTMPLDFGPEHAAWECPRCHKVNAPHIDQCTCT